jgi:hypothetical protein
MALQAFEKFGYKHRLGVWEVPEHRFPRSRFPNSFILSHLHADHYNGLMAASLERRYEGAWMGLKRVFLPGLPDLPGGLKKQFFLALFTLNAVTAGVQTGHPDYDFLGAVGKLSHTGSFRHRQLFRGDTFVLGGFRHDCLWPPRTVEDEALGGDVRKALHGFYQKLEAHPILRNLHGRISEHQTFAALAEEPEEGDPVHLEPPLEPPPGGEHDTDVFADLAREMEPTNKQLRRVANDHIDPSNLSYHHFRKFLERAGLPLIGFHDLRHTLATVMFSELRAHPKAVQWMFGHKDIRITMDTYTHVLPTMQGPYVAELDELFGD